MKKGKRIWLGIAVSVLLCACILAFGNRNGFAQSLCQDSSAVTGSTAAASAGNSGESRNTIGITAVQDTEVQSARATEDRQLPTGSVASAEQTEGMVQGIQQQTSATANDPNIEQTVPTGKEETQAPTLGENQTPWG